MAESSVTKCRMSGSGSFALSLASVLTWASLPAARADIGPPPGSRRVSVCHKMLNVTSGEYILVGSLERGPATNPSSETEVEPVSANACLPEGYWSNFRVAMVKKSTFEAKKALGSVKIRFDRMAVIPTNSAGTITVKDSDPLKDRTYEYSIAGSSGEKFVVYASAARETYSNGQAPKALDYPKPPGF